MTETLISILRGINVSGQRKILMTDLKTLYETLGFRNVTTYIQSGNVVFRTEKNQPMQELAGQLERKIFDRFGFEVPVILRSLEEMRSAASLNPFLFMPNVDPEKLHITFLADLPEPAALEKIRSYAFPPDQFIIDGRQIYLYCPVSYGNTKLSNNFFESKLKVTATTRNRATVNKLVEIADISV